MEAATAPPVQRRYGALRTIVTILRVLAVVVAVVGGIGVLAAAGVSASQGQPGPAIAFLIGGILYVALFVLFFLAYAEVTRLLIDLEENTRQSALLLAALGTGGPGTGAAPVAPAGPAPGAAPPAPRPGGTPHGQAPPPGGPTSPGQAPPA